MTLISEVLGKQLICLETAQIVGTISNIMFDENFSKPCTLEIVTDNDEDTEYKFVDFKKVTSFTEFAAVVTESSAITNSWNSVFMGVPNPINSDCFNQSGKFLDRVSDVTMEGNKVESIIIGGKTYLPKQVISISKNILIINDSGKPVKISRPKVPSVSSAKKVENVKIHEGLAPAIIETLNRIKNPVIPTLPKILTAKKYLFPTSETESHQSESEVI